MTTQQKYSISQYGCFVLLSWAILLTLFSVLRLAFLAFHHVLAQALTPHEVLTSLLIGVRFDLIVTCWIMAPVLFGFFCFKQKRIRRFFVNWLTVMASLCILLSISELDFYGEFHQRLNSLVFEYAKQDPRTVGSMIWNGYPVVTYLTIWVLATLFIYWLFTRINKLTSKINTTLNHHDYVIKSQHRQLQGAVFLIMFLFLAAGARGTLRHGSPLQWGDAFYSENLFANHLGLNGVFTLTKAIVGANSSEHSKFWEQMPIDKATQETRHWIVTPSDKLEHADIMALLRTNTPPVHESTQQIKNVVVIFMESFAGAFVGALKSDMNITPEFDALAQKGLLFTRFFSNGTHTHQGMFASLGCFPNVPGHEYLMTQPEGDRDFSGLPRLLKNRDFQDVYLYNGDFSWDNMHGFFAKQGITKFIGRDDFINPVFVDPTWGVSDQDMFDRSIEELDKLDQKKPFVALLQTLSNHSPFELPSPLPITPVTDQGDLNLHLTTMRYADWALGRFFKAIEQKPYFKNTLFVLYGDHGFATHNQVTDIDLTRFHVPLLLIGPGIRETYGATNDTVGSQVDISPTVMGILGKPFEHQCWGRNLVDVNNKDLGFAVIKPSGNDDIAGFIWGQNLVVRRPPAEPKFYHYDVSPLHAEEQNDPDKKKQMDTALRAVIERATTSLKEGSTGLAADFIRRKQ